MVNTPSGLDSPAANIRCTDERVCEEVASPCLAVCELGANDICSGCYRSLEEIGQWLAATRAQRLEILANARERRGR